MKRLIVSDVHIGDNRFRFDKELSELISDNYDEIIINGDFLELYASNEDDIFNNRFYSKSLRAMRQASKNKRIIYIKGNHDESVTKKYLDYDITWCNEYEFETGDKKIIVVHGHKFETFDKYFGFMSKIIVKIQHKIYNWFGLDIQKNLRKICIFGINVYDRMAEKLLKRAGKRYEKEFDAVIIGHTHIQAHLKDKNISIDMYNDGDMVEHGTYIEVENGKVSLKKL